MLDKEELYKIIDRIFHEIKMIDIHTHLYPPTFDRFFLRGIDDLLTYHYLVAETLRYIDMNPDKFYSLPKEKQAEVVWKTLFVERTPISEASMGIMTILNEYNLDVNLKDLDKYRRFFKDIDPEEHVNLVFNKANIDFVVMTNDPFDEKEISYWKDRKEIDLRFKPSLRLDLLVNNWEEAYIYLKDLGYKVSYDLGEKSIKEIRRFLEYTFDIINPLYLAVSLPPDYKYPDDSLRNKILENIIFPFAESYNLPVALMIGVKRRVNPMLRVAGDSLGKTDITVIENLCRTFSHIRFLVTMLSRENQHELCVTARKFKNLMIFGCWWFLNNPSLVEEITRMRFELLGFSFIPQHSDARVLDQLIYKWKHSVDVIKNILVDKYWKLLSLGLNLKEEDIKRDITQLFRKNFEDFCLYK